MIAIYFQVVGELMAKRFFSTCASFYDAHANTLLDLKVFACLINVQRCEGRILLKDVQIQRGQLVFVKGAFAERRL